MEVNEMKTMKIIILIIVLITIYMFIYGDTASLFIRKDLASIEASVEEVGNKFWAGIGIDVDKINSKTIIFENKFNRQINELIWKIENLPME